MTETEWTTEERSLQRQITAASKKAKEAQGLADKLEMKVYQAGLEAKLRHHRLNRYELTEG